MNEISYRKYEDGDEVAILELYNSVFSTHRTLEQWKWAYKTNPVGRMDMVLAFAGDRLVGHSAGIPLMSNHDGRLVNTSRIQNVLVDAEFRGKGIFTETLLRLTDQLCEGKVDFVLTYPNDNSLPGFMKTGRYSHLGDIAQYHGKANSLQQAQATGITVRMSGPQTFSEADVAFFQLALAPFSICNTRDLPYLNWRYAAGSENVYRVFRAERNGDLVGLAVAKTYPDGASIDLVEFIVNGGAEIVRSLLRSILTAYNLKEAGGFNIWSMQHYAEHSALTDMGFVRTDRAAHIVCAPLSGLAAGRSDSQSSYYLSMGDSDVF